MLVRGKPMARPVSGNQIEPEHEPSSERQKREQRILGYRQSPAATKAAQ
jgi:hypothetical protein